MENFNATGQARINILIADDHKLIRESWKTILEKNPIFSVKGLAADGEEIINLAQEHDVDVILMDINMRPVDGLEATSTILQKKPRVKIVAVSMNADTGYVKKIMQLGALGYISKNSSMQELEQAIMEVYQDRKYICNEVKTLLVNKVLAKDSAGPEMLTKRELSVIQLLRKGMSSREIAIQLGIAGRTIEVHRYNILKKLKVKNTAALVNSLSEMGI